MNTEKIVLLIKEVKEDFIYTSLRRMDTSTFNKRYHEKAIDFAKHEHWSLLENLISNQQYAKILRGVIACLPTDCKNKSELFDEVNK